MPPPGENHGYGQSQGRELGQGQGQDHHEDGDYEDEGLNDDTDGDVLSGPEDQSERRRRQQRQRDGDNGGVFTPTRSAPQPPNLSGPLDPKSREAEIAHIMYIQQQQALFLQEKAMNPPLKQKSSNGNLSGNGSDHSKPRRKGSRHRKQISVIGVPKLVSTTNQIKTVPIVRPADQSDNDDAGTKSEYTSGGEGIKKTVRKMRRAVRHAANGAFNNDDSDRDENLGSKSDAEKKGGLKQLKALKSKIAKKLHRPSHGGQSSSREHVQEHNQGSYGEQGNRPPVQFFSEENLRSRYLAQEQHQGFSLGTAGASLRRSNTTRDNVGPGPMHRRRDSNDFMDGGKQEYDSQNENEEDTPLDAQQQETDADAEAQAKKAKFGSRTFDKDEMIEVKDGTGESFFVPRWDFDPRADELDSSKSVISVQSSKKLERSASGSTMASTLNKPAASIAERLQGATVKEEGGEHEQPSTAAEDVPTPTSPLKSDQNEATEELTQDKEVLSVKEEQGSQPLDVAEIASESTASASASSNSGLDSRASVISGSSDVSSVGGIVVAQVLTRQNSMKRSFKRQGSSEEQTKAHAEAQSQPMPQHENEQAAMANSPHFGLGIFMPSSPTKEQEQEQDSQLNAVMAGFHNSGKELPPLPHDGTFILLSRENPWNIVHPIDHSRILTFFCTQLFPS